MDRSPNGPRARRGERRQKLLAQAAVLFAARGYAATTPAEIAAAAGLSEALFFRYYADKEELFRALLSELLGGALGAWRDETAEVADPQVRLLALGRRYLESVRADGTALRAVGRTLLEDGGSFRADVQEQARAWEEFLAGLIRQGQQTGVFRRSLPPAVGAWQLIHAALGCALTHPLGLPPHGHGDYAAQAIECAVHGLLKTDV
jgi:AcrR family transcriptional regulator